MAMSYCTVEDVLKVTKANPKNFGFKKDDPAHERKLHDLINDWIMQSEAHINAYCKRDWYNRTINGQTIPVGVPGVVKNVCIRLTANIMAFAYYRQDLPIKNVEDLTVKVNSSEIFTDDLKEDLKPYRRPRRARVFKI